jgi:hypothetical protein
MESTLLHSFLKAGNLKRWLAKPDCPAVIKECKMLFDKIYAPKLSEATVSEGGVDADRVAMVASKAVPEDLRPLLGLPRRQAIMRARLRHNGIIYATSNTHIGNSLVQFYPQGSKLSLVPGSIKYIYQEQDRFVFAVQRQLPISTDISDPYAIYPHFPAKLYSSQLSVELEQVQLDWIYSHYARWNLSATQSVVLSLSRVCRLILIASRSHRYFQE